MQKTRILSCLGIFSNPLLIYSFFIQLYLLCAYVPDTVLSAVDVIVNLIDMHHKIHFSVEE